MKTAQTKRVEMKGVPVSASSLAKGRKQGIKEKAPAKQKDEVDARPYMTHDVIALRAWAIWMFKGCVPGQDIENWEQAKLELTLKLLRWQSAR